VWIVLEYVMSGEEVNVGELKVEEIKAGEIEVEV
jgi:hypothetical protein